MRVFDLGGEDGRPRVAGDRVLTVPNVLSVARIAVLPVVWFDLADGRLLRALVLLAVFASTDWFDGYLARRLDQVSRVGMLLDPLSDRLFLVVAGTGYVVAGVLPLWALLLVLARDLAVLAVGAWLMARGSRPPPVGRLGKTATFALMTALGGLLLAAVVGEGAADPQPVLHAASWVLLVPSLVLYWLAAVGYARDLAAPGR